MHLARRHILRSGRLPFEGKDKPEIKRNITANNLATFPSFLTPQCQAFIRAMLTYDVDQRPSCVELLRHPYIAMYMPPPKPAHTLPGVITLQAFTPGAAGGASGRVVCWLGCKFCASACSTVAHHLQRRIACPPRRNS